MKGDLGRDLNILESRAFGLADWTENELRRYHRLAGKVRETDVALLRKLRGWLLSPWSLWPCDFQKIMTACLDQIERGRALGSRHRLLLELLPDPSSESICSAVTAHERQMQHGSYEELLRTGVKFAQMNLALESRKELQWQWEKIKVAFNVQTFQDHKGLIRRTMATERNLRPPLPANFNRRAEAFQAVFDAFCLRWNLLGMHGDKPLLLKLAVHVTPYGTMIHIPSYWSFDPKRDIQWEAVAKLHRTRVPGRQGAALAAGLAERMKKAAKLQQLDEEARRRKLKGQAKHSFLCSGLGWVAGTSAKRLSRLRAEFSKT